MKPTKPSRVKSSIDEGFFKNYAGSGKPYNKVWRQYCYFDECCALFKSKDAPQLKSICVLGAATGQVVEGFSKKFDAKIYGCEISGWAHSQINQTLRSRIKLMDMRRYIKEMHLKKKVFDLTFSNSLIYLEEKHIPLFLKKLSKVTKYLHVKSSTQGAMCPDPYRKTLKPYKWWLNKYAEAGFVPVPGTKRQRTYLWKSIHFWDQ